MRVKIFLKMWTQRGLNVGDLIKSFNWQLSIVSQLKKKKKMTVEESFNTTQKKRANNETNVRRRCKTREGEKDRDITGFFHGIQRGSRWWHIGDTLRWKHTHTLTRPEVSSWAGPVSSTESGGWDGRSTDDKPFPSPRESRPPVQTQQTQTISSVTECWKNMKYASKY